VVHPELHIDALWYYQTVSGKDDHSHSVAVNPELCGQEARTGLPPLGRAWVSGLVKPMIPDVKGEQKIELTYRVNTQTRKVRDDKTLRASLRGR